MLEKFSLNKIFHIRINEPITCKTFLIPFLKRDIFLNVLDVLKVQKKLFAILKKEDFIVPNYWLYH